MNRLDRAALLRGRVFSAVSESCIFSSDCRVKHENCSVFLDSVWANEAPFSAYSGSERLKCSFLSSGTCFVRWDAFHLHAIQCHYYTQGVTRSSTHCTASSVKPSPSTTGLLCKSGSRVSGGGGGSHGVHLSSWWHRSVVTLARLWTEVKSYAKVPFLSFTLTSILLNHGLREKQSNGTISSVTQVVCHLFS